MKTITVEYNLYEYNELNEKAREKAKQEYLKDYRTQDLFDDDTNSYINELFPNSDLKLQYSFNYCQGDGVNIYGNFNCVDFLKYWNCTKKERRTIEFYLWCYNDCELENNSWCSYSLKTEKNAMYEADILIDELEDQSIRNINEKLIKKFYIDLFSYLRLIEKEIENAGYDWFYNYNDEEIKDWYKSCNVMFYEDGTPYYDYD